MDFDKKYINISKFLLKKIIGTTFPNPPVVSLIVESDKNFKNCRIVNFGFTNFGGRPHAEAEALKDFKNKRDRKYTLYSTLEPCCHKGRDEDCVSKILRAKINRVVYSIKDPDKRVNGGGIKILKKYGVEVIGGLNKKEINEIYSGYIFNRKLNKPKVTLKVGCSLDSKIAFKPNQKDSITNNMAKKIVHLYRSEFDGILVGANTVKTDNPKLSCRVDGLKKTSPLRIVLSENLDFSLNSEVFKDCKKNPTILITTKSNFKKIDKLLKKNVQVLFFKKTKYNLKNILTELSNYGICNLMVEGGRSIFSSFINENLVDQIMIFRSHFFIGINGLDFINKVDKNFKHIFEYKKISLIENNSLEILEKKT